MLALLAANGRVRLVDWVNWILSCPHRHTSFPLSVRTGGLHDSGPTRPPEVYVVCLACGQRLQYAGTERATPWWFRRSKHTPLAPYQQRGLK